VGRVALNLARPADALESFARATRLDPTRVEAWVGIANATMTLGELGTGSGRGAARGAA